MTTPTLTLLEKHSPLAWRKLGTGAFYWTVFHVYDLSLYCADEHFSLHGEFALEAQYRRPLDKAVLIAASCEALRPHCSAQQLTDWQTKLENILIKVERGDYLLVQFSNRSATTAFFLNDQALGKIPGHDFLRAYAALWLGENTAYPALKQALLTT